MAARVLLLSILFTVGLLVKRSKGLELGLQFGVEPQDSVVSRNKPTTLQCSSPTPNVSFSWTLDNKPIPLVNNSRIQLLSNGSLYFRKVLHKKGGGTQSDQGTYRCVIRSPLGALVSRPAQLRLAFMSPELSEEGSRVRVVNGDPTLLTCGIESLPLAHITWHRDGQPLLPSNRYIFIDNGNLLISKAQKEDGGEYNCMAWNSLMNKTRLSDVISLVVEPREGIVPVEIVQPIASGERLNWTQGEAATIICLARGDPAPMVKWTKLMPDESSVLVTNITEGVSVLTINNVTESDKGWYTCVASQVIPEKESNTVSSVTVVEHVLRPPVITKGPKSQEFPSSKTVRFQCEVDGFPPPDIVWFRDGHKLHINGRIKLRKELVLSNTVNNDSGIYECMASNSVGSVWAAARLMVNVSRDQPRAPSHLSCTPLNATTVYLSWDQPHTSGVKAFTVHYLPTDGGEETMSVTHMTPNQLNQNLTIDKLSPYTNYTFYVRSYNSNAASDKSEEVVCLTAESVPRGTPVIQVEPKSPMTVLVEWTELSASVALGKVSEHKVQWRPKYNPYTNVDIVPGDVTRYLITGLTPNSEYEVRVLAATAKGWPSLGEDEMPWTAVITPSPESVTPLLLPPTVHLTVINATTIQVRWTPAADSLAVDGYLLSYHKHNSQSDSPIRIPANSTEYLLLNLEPQTWYEVQVKAMSGALEGEVGVRAIRTLPPLHQPSLALPPPFNLDARPITPHTINLTWDLTPAPVNLSHFTISYRIVSPSSLHNGDDNDANVLQSKTQGIQVTGLRPYTMYELKVRTHDHDNRHSEYSQKLECRTLEGVPDIVQDINWKPLNLSSVRVMWKEPNVTNGHIRGYSIAYTPLPKLPQERWNNLTFNSIKPSAEVTGLSPNVKYTMVIQAATSAGLGPASEAFEVLIPAREKHFITSTTPSLSPPPKSHDQFLGIVLGCGIGGCCVVLCMVSLIYRRKCSKPSHGQCRANGTPHACFHAGHDPGHHEMQCLPNHLDTKGGQSNGEMNGLKLPLLSNGRLPNGLVTRERTVRITENPQFDCGVAVSCEELRQPSDEGDSLLSGHSLNDTQLTTVTPIQPLSDKHEPDDGFHESHQPVVGPNG